MTKKTQPSIEATPPPADPIVAAQTAILDAQQAAIPAVLRLRDLEYCHARGILAENDPTLTEARESAIRRCKALDTARARLAALERDAEREQAATRTAQAQADQTWRRVWSEAHNPQLVERLAAARAEEELVRGNPYTGTSSRGMGDLRIAQARIAAVEDALARVAKQAPALANMELPAWWASFTPEERREWVLQLEQFDELAVG
ncbi:MAG TPA: hypothetical protein VNL71_14595 [Chloroflexota bacterium]|nr:hypothetical protein [Chloroflexota bacterium]